MEVAKQIQLTLKGLPGGILAAVVVAKNHSHRMLQLGDRLGETEIAVTEITDKQHRVGLEDVEKGSIVLTPVTMQIACDRKPEPRTRWCQGLCLGCAPSCRRWSS